MSRSAVLAATNESAFRRANERLEERAAEFGFAEGRMPYLCECEDEHCMKVVRLARAEYEEVRAGPKRSLMIPGHQEADDLVVQKEAEFVVIEKRGEEDEFVAEQDPSSANA
jgi:hypothetical protein